MSVLREGDERAALGGVLGGAMAALLPESIMRFVPGTFKVSDLYHHPLVVHSFKYSCTLHLFKYQ